MVQDVPLTLEESDKTELLRERESTLIRIIEAIENIAQLPEWSTLKTLIFDSRIEHLEKQLKSESEQNKLNESEVYRLQGRLFEARKYNLETLQKMYRDELTNIKKLIITQPTER